MLLPQKNRTQTIGHGLIFAGILVWAPYFYLKFVAQQPVDVVDYLQIHLHNVTLPGGGTLTMTKSFLSSDDGQNGTQS